MYARLKADALDVLERSREFERGVDNTVYHKGYPINYREQGGVPSIQISVAPDRRRADIDMDYRSSSLPAALFNGHLSASNSANAIGDVAECDARARGAAPPDPLPLEYGEAFGMIVRFQTKGGEAPVLRLLWRKEDGVGRIRSYGVEMP
jgi:hypothetical protein